MRQGDWKLVQYNVEKNPPGSFELYNLRNDPSEESDLAAKKPEVVAEMKRIFQREHTPSTVFKFAHERN